MFALLILLYVSLFEGVTSNTDAAYLAEKFSQSKCPTKVDKFVIGAICTFNSGILPFKFYKNSQVVGVPVTLNGDLKNQFVEANVGFDTVCKVGVVWSKHEEYTIFLSALSNILRKFSVIMLQEYITGLETRPCLFCCLGWLTAHQQPLHRCFFSWEGEQNDVI